MADTRIYRHPKRPEWGMAMVTEWLDSRVRFVFEDAQVRAFKADNLNVLEIVHLDEAEAAPLRTKLQRSAASALRAKRVGTSKFGASKTASKT